MTTADNRYSIVAMNHCGSEAVVAQLKVGTDLMLVREPDNKFDKNAVAVWSAGVKIGYLPKAQNRVVAMFIDQKGEAWRMPRSPLATDAKAPEDTPPQLAVAAIFVRSPNSGYPMAQIATP